MTTATPTRKKDSEAIEVNVVVLEDNDTEAERMKGFLEGSLASIPIRNGVKLSLQQIQLMKTKADVLKVLEGDVKVPDWIFCDFNLREKNAGLEVANTISSRRYPTDILLYTQAGTINIDNELLWNRYGNVWTANRDEIEGTIDKMVWRATTKLSDPEYLRGLVLSRATDTEVLIDDCVGSLFRIDDKLKDFFKWALLRSENYGPGSKFHTVATYLNRLPEDEYKSIHVVPKQVEGHIKEIFRTRNLVAHGIAISDGKGGLQIRNRLTPENQKKGKQQNSPSYFPDCLPRNKIKDHLHLCYKTDKELQKLQEDIVRLGNGATSQ
ncbi:MAG: hypothetical protein M1431_03940 [Candidatus Thermoplasmatota archaeon]|nr:hypothetical protein [Candidatus Thermoplasmatota archaeon]